MLHQTVEYELGCHFLNFRSINRDCSLSERIRRDALFIRHAGLLFMAGTLSSVPDR